jgi:Collagen triple helix repeat (20 copies)
MPTRNRTFAALSAILFAAFLNVAISAPANAATININFANFRGAWSSTITYGAGAVVIYNGASYISLISSNKNVAPSSSTTAWSIMDPPGATGATGPAGAQGPAGPQGAQGTTGATGAQGIMGPPGPVGSAGATGAKGATGSTGPAGAQGAAGPQGLHGSTGPIGPQGLLGATGPIGPAGATGATGATGQPGPQGLTGATGSQGPAGPAGTNGNVGFAYENTWTRSTPYTANNVVTENGTSYVALTNNTAVDPANDVSTSGGNWAILAAAGAQGPAGPTGAIGPAGPTGAIGPAGAQGAAGPQGLQGFAGPIGPQGLLGATGPIGAAGATGATGATGQPGPQGLTGAIGAAGPQGPAGPAGTNGINGTSVGFLYENTWTSSTPYTLNNVVTENGTSYVALTNNTAVDPANDVSTSGGNWAIVAAAGAQGPAGSTGAIGPAGTTGAIGPAGAQGAAGPQGLQGFAGPIGPQGLLGATGPMGPAGTAGATGPAGAQGSAGPVGPVGATGAAGAAGAQGLPGATGAQGLAGPAGPAGPQGPAGVGAGSTSCSTYITGPQTIQGNVVVPDGAYCSLGYVPPYTTPCCNPTPPPGYGPVLVTGNVTVGKGSSLVVGLNSTISGNLLAKNCAFVELVSEGNEEVDGNVQILNCNGGSTSGDPAFLSTGTGSVIYGSFQCMNNTGPCVLEVATVGATVQIVNNVTSSPSKIEANQIFGNLQCLNNSPSPSGSGSGNKVTGSEQGQCTGF